MKRASPKRGPHGMGWVRDLPDHRDQMYKIPPAMLRSLPEQVDLRKHFPPAYRQGRIESCSANVIAAAIQYERARRGHAPDFPPSRLFIYYNERALEGRTPVDSGARLRDGIKTVAKHGVCPESEWPYDDRPAVPHGGAFPRGSKAAAKPPRKLYHAAKQHRAVYYYRVEQTVSHLRACLAMGCPFLFGFSIYDTFFEPHQNPRMKHRKQRTVIPMPTADDRHLGGHAALAVGYDHAKKLFICRNSWGPKQGEHGYFYMPYAYLTHTHLSADFWVISATAQ